MKTLTFPKEDVYKGDLILVNASHPIKEEPLPFELQPVHPDFPGISLRRRAAQMLTALLQSIDSRDRILPVSGYRTLYEQTVIFEECLREEGVGYTTGFVAQPNCSEHQTGLAIDLAEKRPDIDFICPDFPYTGICQRFRENAVKYGFIERYQQGKESVTNIAAEPWHFRYVGCPHAQLITEMNVTLEEYLNGLKQHRQDGSELRCLADGRNYEIFFLPVDDFVPVAVTLPENVCCQVSGNNEDGLLVTLWKKSDR
ncbi:MAG TPA: D-alanyl-D-alanine carboxypeptidase family protein [Syntrophomonas sp.]|nr:D-alanyl-D-alanine carboxypeptidase family protein [Syntrophomonas sp.]